MINGLEARLTWARETARGAPLRREVADGGGSNSGFELAQEKAMDSAHQGPKKSAFGIPEGFFPDKESGYYYNTTSGYYYDADRKLYYHPTTQGWYQADPITGHLHDYVDPATAAAMAAAQQKAADEAAAAEAQAAREARMAAQAPAAPTLAAAGPAAAELEEGHVKVVLGMGKPGKAGAKGKGLLVKKPGLFKQTLEDKAAVLEEDAVEEAPPKKEDEMLVDWDQLICQLCKRKFKERAILQKHVDESALHKTNLREWQQKQREQEEEARDQADRQHERVRAAAREREREREHESRDSRGGGGGDGGYDERDGRDRSRGDGRGVPGTDQHGRPHGWRDARVDDDRRDARRDERDERGRGGHANERDDGRQRERSSGFGDGRGGDGRSWQRGEERGRREDREESRQRR